MKKYFYLAPAILVIVVALLKFPSNPDSYHFLIYGMLPTLFFFEGVRIFKKSGLSHLALFFTLFGLTLLVYHPFPIVFTAITLGNWLFIFALIYNLFRKEEQK